MSDKILICRCEDVTKNEVEEAVQKGHDDLESLKRYTGFGTGFCQGKQCVALASRVLVELGGKAPTLPITPRPPFHPIFLAHLAGIVDDEEPE
jgi:NAD(P)H-nitrite reductase large subunit